MHKAAYEKEFEIGQKSYLKKGQQRTVKPYCLCIVRMILKTMLIAGIHTSRSTGELIIYI